MFAAQVGLQDPAQGPVLDESWPTVVRTEVRDNVTHTVHSWSSGLIKVCMERKELVFFWLDKTLSVWPAALLERLWRGRPLHAWPGAAEHDGPDDSRVGTHTRIHRHVKPEPSNNNSVFFSNWNIYLTFWQNLYIYNFEWGIYKESTSNTCSSTFNTYILTEFYYEISYKILSHNNLF